MLVLGIFLLSIRSKESFDWDDISFGVDAEKFAKALKEKAEEELKKQNKSISDDIA